jgi:hypothetical protein
MRFISLLFWLICSAQTGYAQEQSWLKKLLANNFTLKKEIFLQITAGDKVEADPPLYSRQSVGFEALKKFSTKTSTIAAFDLQSRLVRRDNYIDVLNDMEGKDRAGFYLEYHNVYLDLYNVFNPLLNESGRGKNLGRFNWRTGHFYLPFGINLQTDTHGAMLQLSNEQNFGFDRDWYTGLYGSISRNFNYDCSYLLGSGYRPRFRGQSGLLAARISLSNRFRNEYGLEGGLSVISGERLFEQTMDGSPDVDERQPGEIIRTFRVGLDGRYTRMLWQGTVAMTSELSGGEDTNKVFTQLHLLEYTSRSRTWGCAGQYQRFWNANRTAQGNANASLIGEFTIYSKNDVSSSVLRWIKFNVARQLERREGNRSWLYTAQYYYYW